MLFARSTLMRVVLLLFVAIQLAWAQDKIDLNTANRAELANLPIDSSLVEAIYTHRIVYGRFNSIFELRDVAGITDEIYAKLKPLVILAPKERGDFRIEQREKMYAELEQYASEGTNDNEADHFIDQALNPNNINKMSYQQILNLPRVSPIDAARIRFHLENVGPLSNDRDLKNVDNLDYYGYRSVRNFISYKDGIGNDSTLHGFYTFRAYDTEFIGEEGEIFSSAGYRKVEEERSFNLYHKFRLTANNYKYGFSYSRNLGESNHNDYKLYQQMSDLNLGAGIELEDVIFGNYSVAFGHGVVMENTDFFSPRKDGLGFKKRYQGIIGDISRSRNHDLFGIAAKLNYKKRVEFTGFISKSERDAVLNQDGSINMFINLNQRLDTDYLYHVTSEGAGNPNYWPVAVDSVPNMVKNVKELTFGGELKYSFSPGNYLAATYYESWYDRYLRPNATALFLDDQQDDFQARFRNNELVEGLYGGPESNIKDGGKYKSFRRVFGFHGQFVLGDWAFSGEYGILDADAHRTEALATGDSLVISHDTYTPTALVLSSYIQKPNFSLLIAYRDYDLAYDNPYQHSMSNYAKFKGTIIDDSYRLHSPYYTQLHLNADQPQAERGFHINARYRFSGKLTFITEDDIWERVSDGVEQYRLVARLQYRPVFPLRLEVRQKWQARDEDNEHSIDYFTNNETRLTLRAYLSNRDRLELYLGRSHTRFSVRPDLSFNPDPTGNAYDNINASILSPGNVIGAGYLHNFSDAFSIQAQFLSYQGFYWNFEDTQFAVLNSINGSYRYWISAVARISDNLSCRLKFTHDDKLNDNNRYIRNIGDGEVPIPYYNVEEIGSKNFTYFELVMSF